MANKLRLFWGAEDFLIEEQVRQLAAKQGEVRFFGDNDLSEENLVNALQGQGLFGSDQLLIVRLTDLTDPVWDKFVGCLADNQIVFWAEKLGKSSKLSKFLQATAETREFKPYAEWEQEALTAWIVKRAAKEGKKLSAGAAQLLLLITGAELRKLASEVSKLVTFAGDRTEITEEDVRTLASPGQLSIFALTEALADKDLKKTYRAWQVIKQDKIEPFSLLSLLVSNYRVLLALKEERDQGKICRELGASPFFVKKLAAKSGRFQVAELKEAIKYILNSNLKIRNGERDQIVLETLFASLCGTK